MFNPLRKKLYCLATAGTMILLCLNARGQSDTVKLRFIVTDAFTKRSVQGANVVNRTSGTVVSTDVNGYVETTALRNDKLYVFTTGYHSQAVSIEDSVVKPSYFFRIVIEPFSTGLDQNVIILGGKTLDNIGADKQHLGQTPSDLNKPKIPALEVMDKLYDKVSARGKEREKLKKEMVADDQWKVMSEYLNYCNERSLITLPQEEYNDFISFCSFNIAWLKGHGDYDIISAICAKFEEYRKQKAPAK